MIMTNIPWDKDTYWNIVQTVRLWPPEQRFLLVQDLLQSLASEIKKPAKQRIRTLARARALLATDRPAPSDQEVEQWLDEHRRWM